MRRIRKEAICLATIFIFLCFIRALSQYSNRLNPTGPIRPVIVYFAYVMLLALWWVTMHNRVTQRNMRIFLTAENILMLFGMTIRFIQEAFWYLFVDETLVLTNTDILLMRLSGYSTNIAFILIPLFGLYASFCLGKTTEYRFSSRWYTMLIPALILVITVMTNDIHHFTYRPLQDELQFALYYRPYIGFYVFIAWSFSLLVARIFILYDRSKAPNGTKHVRLVPLLFTVMIILVNIPYFVTFFLPMDKLLEQEVILFFLEILVWESCILIGIVPVNTRYNEVFDRSTVAMRIVDEHGHPYFKSAHTPELEDEIFEMLKKETTVRMPGGTDLHLHKIHGGYAIWQNDISGTLALIDELQHSREVLEFDVELLQQEIKIRSDEEAVKEKNHIYNKLTDEVGKQLSMLSDMLEKRDKNSDDATLFKKICLIGTYIKRRCNLRLIELSDSQISCKDLELCYHELIGCLRLMGIKADILWNTGKMLAPEFAIFTVDAFELLLEYEHFEMRSIIVVFEIDGTVSVQVESDSILSGMTPANELQRLNKENYDMELRTYDKGYQVFLSNGGH